MNILAWIKLFESLSQLELDNLSIFCQERFLKAWEILFNEWDEAIALYILKNWRLKAYKDRSDWKKILWFIESWEMVWEMAIFDSVNLTLKNRMASVVAEDNSVLLVIMNYSIVELSEKYNYIYEKIIKIIQQRKQMNDNI